MTRQRCIIRSILWLGPVRIRTESRTPASICITALCHAGRAKWLYSYFREWFYRSSNVCFISSLE
jgi:hypothetical protein